MPLKIQAQPQSLSDPCTRLAPAGLLLGGARQPELLPATCLTGGGSSVLDAPELKSLVKRALSPAGGRRLQHRSLSDLTASNREERYFLRIFFFPSN